MGMIPPPEPMVPEHPVPAVARAGKPAQVAVRSLDTAPLAVKMAMPEQTIQPFPEGVESATSLTELEERIKHCMACPLGFCRTRFVFGEGNPQAKLMFIGEGPGRDEDLQGRPFVGRAGELLDRMIEAIGFKRGDVYIANVVKCRPPDNRTPTPQESQTCLRHLKHQIELVRPTVIVTLGATPLRELVGVGTGITRVRGQWQRLDMLGGIPVMPTFHPAYVLRQYTKEVRGAVWQDLLAAKSRLETS